MTELKHFAVNTDEAILLETLSEDGALVLDDVLEADFLAQLRTETDPYVEATGNGEDDFGGRLTTRTGGLVSRSAQCRSLIAYPKIVALANQFLAPYCERIQLHLTQIIRLRPGQGKQPIHRDRWAWGKHLAHIEPQFNTIWAVTDFTAENGATNVVPRSVDLPDDAKIQPEQIRQAEMRAGSVFIYSGGVFHGGGENRSNADRIGINLTYTLGWLRQEENQYLSTPPELAKQYAPELQELLGYAMGQYALGYFTPPGAAGEAPELVPPQYALGHKTQTNSLGDVVDYKKTTESVGRTRD